MKLFKYLINTLFIAAAFCFVACEDDEGVAETLKRDTDAVSLKYASGSTASIYVRYKGSWTTSVECFDSEGSATSNWFYLSPDSGIGDGKEYQIVTVIADRNPGGARTGNVYIIPQEGETLVVSVSQDEGYFSVGDPTIAGELKSGSESSAYVTVSYDKAFGGEEIDITASLSGACAGLEVTESYTGTIEREGNGSIVLPITGTPEEIGDLVCHILFKLDGEVMFDGDVSASILSENVIFSFGFDLFVWGGDYPNNQAGVTPNPAGSNAGAEYMGDEDAPYSISAGTDGTNDVFLTMTETYRINRGVQDWSGSKVYEHPGYVKLGTSSASGWIMTPKLTNLTASPETVSASIDFMRFDNEEGVYYVTAEGAGDVTNGTINSVNLPPPTGSSSRKWTTLTFTIVNATNETRIKVCAEDESTGNHRLNVDNFVVMGSAEVEVTEQLPMPENITYTPGENSISFEWDPVTGATSYEVSIATQDAPDFKNIAEVETANHEFTNIEPGFYFFSIRALCQSNSAFNSEYAELLVGTEGYVPEKLDNPSNLMAESITPTTAKISWDTVSGASTYSLVVAPTAGGSEVVNEIISETSYSLTGLEETTEYKFTVKARLLRTASDSEYDSDEVSETFTTIARVPLTAPELKVVHKSYAQAIMEWTYTEEMKNEQSVGSSDTFNFRLCDANGNVLREVDKFAAFNFTKYPGYRIVWGGLDANTTYKLGAQRVYTGSADTYKDAEWAEVEVTTDAAPDKSSYLLWWDFDNVPFNASPVYGAYGFSRPTSSANWSDPNSLTYGTGDSNTIYSQNLTSDLGQDFYDLYLPGINASDVLSVTDANKKSYSESAQNTLHTVTVQAGNAKFGASSHAAWVTLPAFTTLPEDSTILLEVDACPYAEPSSSGDWYNPSSTEVGYTGTAAEFVDRFYVWAQGAEGVKIEKVEGVTADDAVIDNSDAGLVKLRNEKWDVMKDYSDADPYHYTHHEITISGVGPDTRIMIYTSLTQDGNQHRMWMDNVKVSKVN